MNLLDYCLSSPYHTLDRDMKTIRRMFAIIGALMTGGLAIATVVGSQSAQAGSNIN